MAPYVRNSAELTAHGDRALRSVALDIVEHALAATDPYPLAKQLIRRDGRHIHIGGERIHLQPDARVFFLGAGKASFGIARAVEELLGDLLTAGLVVCKYGQPGTLERIQMRLASHPLPDEAGMHAAAELLELARVVRPGDVVFCGITGGSSALLPLPVAGLSLEDKQRMTALLLSCGADIFEINAIRKHLSRIKGGQLAAAMPQDVSIFNLTVSDVVGNALDYITDPTVPDTSSLAASRGVLDKYGLWDSAPPAVARHLRSGGAAQETPKDLSPRRVTNFILSDGHRLCMAAVERARACGFAPIMLSTMLEGDSREAGSFFGAIAREVAASGLPCAPPCALIAGGETVVNVGNWRASGGPNQEFALSAALAIDGCRRTVVVGLDSDGTDGPTEIAGGIADHMSVARADGLGVNFFDCLRRHDSSRALRSLGDAIVTGATGTNVNDLKFVLIAKES